jgi:class 3 adenylate cyclase/DNA-binding CsgD family transcriptional regulator/tetratricopeptide (TPR) repeat protein
VTELPTGTVTFLFTDVEGSTRLLKQLGSTRYSEVLAEHNRLLRAEFERMGGIETHHQGDSFVVVFRSAGAALSAAVGAQRVLAEHEWPEGAEVRVRMGLHTGEASVGKDGYVGFAVHQASRIGDAGHGGQVLLSTTTATLVETFLPAGVELRDLGHVRLPDVDRPERLFQLVIEGLPDSFPPLSARVEKVTGPPGPPLLERESEVEALRAWMEAARMGSGRVVIIEASSGLGKTRLLGEARRLAEGTGFAVLGARGGELEQEFPYGVVRQLFEPAVAGPAERRADLLSGAAGLAAPLFDGARLAAALEQGADTSFATLHGLFWLVANLAARSPALLVVDDAHWSDHPSLRWIAYLARRLEGLPVLLLLGLRPPEPSDSAALAELMSDPSTSVLRLGALSEAAASMLVREQLGEEGDAEFVAACHEATGGNPLFVRELLSTLAAERVPPRREHAKRVRELGPQAVSRAVRLRLSRLPAEATALARAVAVLGDAVELAHAAHLADLDRTLAAHMAGALARADILKREFPLSFVHPVIRTAVYNELPRGEAEAAHGRAATILADAEAATELVAAQVLQARPAGDARRVEVLREAARISRGRGAPESAVAYLRRALAEPPPEDERTVVLYELGSAEKLVHGPSAAAHLREALADTVEPPQRLQTTIELARALFFSNQIEAAVETLGEAIAQLPAEDSELRRRALAGYLFAAQGEPPMTERIEPYFDESRTLDLDSSRGGRMLLAVLAWRDARARGSREEAVDRARRALVDGALLVEEDAAFYSLPGLIFDAADLLDESEGVWESVFDVARQRGSIFAFAAASGFRARTRYLAGQLEEAAQDARAALEAALAHGLQTGLPYALAFLADALVAMGSIDAADEALAQAGLGDAVPETAHMIFFLSSRARLRLAQGRPAEALRDLATLERIERGVGAVNPGFASWRPEAALARLQLGETDAARAIAEEDLRLARAWGAPRALGVALRTLGIVAAADKRLELLRESVAVLEQSPALLERAQSLVELGAAVRRANQRSVARDFLRRGLELAEICRAAPLAERARAELGAAGARTRSVILSGIESLTTSERRVAEMASEGMTNRQIAQALFVTPKTVEVHLSSVYRKLGIGSRAQLTEALPPAEPVAPRAGASPSS